MQDKEHPSRLILDVTRRRCRCAAGEPPEDKAGSPQLGSLRLRAPVRLRDKGTVPGHQPPVPMTVAPNRQGRSLPDDGRGSRPRQQVPGSPEKAPVHWAQGGGGGGLSPGSRRPARASYPPPHPPPQDRPSLATDTPSLRAGASSPRPPPKGRSPGQEVPAAATNPVAAAAAAPAASPSGFAPHTVATSHGSYTTATTTGPRDPEPLPSGTASPRPHPGPAHCSRPRAGRLSHRPLLSTPCQRGCPARAAPARAPAPSAGRSHPCRSVEGACAVCFLSTRKEAGVPGPGTLGVGAYPSARGRSLVPWAFQPCTREAKVVEQMRLGPLAPGLALEVLPEPARLNLHFCSLSLPSQPLSIPRGLKLSFYPENKTSPLGLPNGLMVPTSPRYPIQNTDSYLPAFFISFLPHSIHQPLR